MSTVLQSALGRLAQATHRRAGSWLFHAVTILAVAAITLGVTYRAVGEPKLLGIDDADITQVYARHIAGGAGYVYALGSEHVEGATSLLWVLVNAAAFLALRHPEGLICAIGFVLTIVPMILMARVADWLAPAANEMFSQRIAVLVWFACLPAYFTWLALTLMDQALWASILALLLAVLSAELLGKLKPVAFAVLASSTAALAVTTRPEAMAQVPLMLGTAALAAWKLGGWPRARAYAAPLVATLCALSALTLWRVSYFGYPFPNTFYAKVSSTEWDNLASGYDYVTSWLLSDALHGAAMLCVVVATVLSATRLFRTPRFETACAATTGRQAVVVVAGAAVIQAMCLQIAIGGDHFGSFRLLQPILPLCATCLAYLVAEIHAATPRLPLPGRLIGLLAILLLAVGLPLRQLRLYVRDNNIGQEFTIGNTGRQVGKVLNGLPVARQWSVGVAAAGGIALTYRGPVVDLLGLNWALMAHATGRRAGLRGHSAFSDAVFWDHMPDLALPMWVAGDDLGSILPYLAFYQGVFHRLLTAPRFQSNYAPILYKSARGTVLVFCRLGLLPDIPDPAFVRLGWDHVPVAP